jgi:Dyp-type peroxidase family
MALTEDDLKTFEENGIDPENPGKYETLLKDLQGNILKGHGRAHAVHLFLKFKDGKIPEVKQWIQDFATTYVTSAKMQSDEAVRYRTEKIPGSVFANFFLSRKGYEQLGFKPSKIPADQPFRYGMKNDTVRNLLADPPVEAWDRGFQEDIHALVLMADDDVVDLLQKVNKMSQQLLQVAEIVQREDGFVLRNECNQVIEHFGFVDGVSQPLFLKRDIVAARIQNVDFSKWDPRAPLSIILVKDRNGKTEDSYGSYLVYRKLEQNVEQFLKDEQHLAEQLGIDKELAGALIMGRFRDGTPVTLADIPAAASNNFNYNDDAEGTKCPFHAHIRKANPRGDLTRVESSVDYTESSVTERSHRIARRGISFGENDCTKKTSSGSGLLFLCFEADIENQFNFMQAAWSNTGNFVKVNVGPDPIIGQAGIARKQQWPKKWGEAETVEGFDFPLWVHMKGGEYFFAPSMSCLTTMAQATQ